MHSRVLARMRSLIRDKALESLPTPPDLVLHVRSWYYPVNGTAYASFLDATAEMLQGASDQWTAPSSVHERKVQVEGRFYRGASHLFSASSSAIQSLVSDYRVERERVTKIGNGLNFSEIPSRTSANVGATNAPVILFVGKESERKGLRELLLAFEGRDPHHDNAQLWVVGGPRERAINNVTYFGLVESREDMRNIYEQATVFCLPSRQESFGLVVPEALSYGLPCVVTDTGELPELIGFGAAGIVVPVQDVVSLRHALNTMLDSPELRESMGRAGRELARSMSWTNVVERMVTALEFDANFRPINDSEISQEDDCTN